jgi:hypothetical protein
LQSAKLLFPPKKEEPSQPSQPPENPASADEATDPSGSNPGHSSFSSSQRVFLRTTNKKATPGPQPQFANQQPSPLTTPGAGKKPPSPAAATDSAAPNSDGPLAYSSDLEDDDAEANDVRDVRKDGDYSEEEVASLDSEVISHNIYSSTSDDIDDDASPEDDIGEITNPDDNADEGNFSEAEGDSDDDAVRHDSSEKVFRDGTSALTAHVKAEFGFTLDDIEVIFTDHNGGQFEFVYYRELQDGEALSYSRDPDRVVERSIACSNRDDASSYHFIVAATYCTDVEFDINLINAQGNTKTVWSGTFWCEQPTAGELSDSAATNSDPKEDGGDDANSKDDMDEIANFDAESCESGEVVVRTIGFDEPVREIRSDIGAIARIDTNSAFTSEHIRLIYYDDGKLDHFEIVYCRELQGGERLIYSHLPDNAVEHSYAFQDRDDADRYHFITAVNCNARMNLNFDIILANTEGAEETVYSGTFSYEPSADGEPSDSAMEEDDLD